MKFKLNIKRKLQIYIISVIAVFLLSAIIYISFSIRETATDNAKQYTKELIARYAKEIELKLNNDLTVIRTLSQVEKTQKNIEADKWKPLYKEMYRHVLKGNKQFDDIWDSWELSNIQQDWTKSFGRYCITAYNDKNGIRIEDEFKSMNGDAAQYAEIKEKNKEAIAEPYLFSFTGNNDDAVLITDMSVPFQDKNGNYLGLVGADIRLERLQKIVSQINPFKNSSSCLISNAGIYTSNPDVKKIGQSAISDFTEVEFLKLIQSGTSFSFSSIDNNGNKYFNIFQPIHIGQTETPWSLGVKVSIDSIVQEANSKAKNYLIMGILMILVIALVIALIARMITNPLKSITKTLQALSEGNVNKSLTKTYNSGDEIEEISIALNKSIQGLIDKTKFAEKIGKNEYDTELELLSDNDTLGQSLVEMQKSLITAKELEVERQKEDQKRQWANEGLAKFADIFRQNNSSIAEISSIFTRELIKYNKANQGTLFLKENDVYKALSTYAYDRDKYTNSEITPGEGLIGACIVEKKSTYLTDIPQGYIKITSGLGDATPNALFICPIQTDTEVLGVIEMASFTEFEEYQRIFIETVCSNFASVVESVKVNEQTKVLLEQTQQQTEEMKAQEEEMRQNLEELQATQEEIAIKSFEMNGVLNALNSSSLVLKLDMEGNLIDINEAFLNLLELPKEGILGKNLKDFTTYANDNKTYEEFWDNLRKGIHQKEEQIIRLSNGKEIWLSQVFSTIFNENNEPVSIMNIATDITERKIQEAQVLQQNEELAAQEEEMRQNLEELQATQEEIAIKSIEMHGVLNALDVSSLVLKLDMEGNLIDINDAFLKVLELPKEVVIGKNLQDFTSYANDKQTYEQFWENLRKGIPQKEEQIVRLSNGKEIWLSQVFSTIFDENNEPISIMNIATDITEKKVQENELMQQNEEMSAQEEMMRLNMEEIEEIQNEAEKRNQEIDSLLEALNSSNFIVEYDLEGKVIDINDKYLKFLSLTKEDALNMSQQDHMKATKENKDDIMWDMVLNGKIWKGNTQLEINNKLFTLIETYTPVKDEDGKIYKILKIANDISDYKIA